ncbi:sigma-E factor negative regulatory protein [Colwellia piezophila]|uniref:sigma-E factor negative regulatory protein n=1 Tax=Colwellia piezophila TaxID=211668 RepID=UPI00036EA4D6|nr:RseA family anti-sigma factor [Colwellia piezophila]
MSENKSESISSLVDNYSPSADDTVSAHLVDSMLKDESLSSTWQNYHLIGDVLRDEVQQSLPLDLSEIISAAIAQEATILSPNSAAQSSNENLPKNNGLAAEDDGLVSQIQASKNTGGVIDATYRFKARVSAFIKPMGQVAIAASAAALMIVGVQHNVTDNLSVTPSDVVQTVPLAGYANPVSFNVQSPQVQHQSGLQKSKQAINEQLVAQRVAQHQRLQALLKDHNQQMKIGSNIK